MNASLKAAVALPFLLLPMIAAASCGSAFCTVNTDWDTQSPWQNDATRLDLRMETIHQDQARSGSDKVTGMGHHQEVETTNRNLLLGLSHAFTPDWNLSVQVPVVSRDHLHIHHHHGAPIPVRWNFTKLGDIQVVAYRRLDDGLGLIGGIKLPTGSIGVRNKQGTLAERSLQPGSGSTDLVLGGFVSGHVKRVDWHTQLRWQRAVSERRDYRPGDQLKLDAGVRYPLGAVQALAQINLLWRARDADAQAEPEDSGGRSLHFSPGVAVSLGKDAQLVALVQLPLFQNVRGTQLTADWAATLGLTMRF